MGARYGYILSPLLRLVPATKGILREGLTGDRLQIDGDLFHVFRRLPQMYQNLSEIAQAFMAMVLEHL
eukprot:5573967-Pyramimonas_sp.AAC.1